MSASSASADSVRGAPHCGRGLRASLWVVQALLALVFGLAGWMKLTMPITALATRLAWAADTPQMMIRFIGAAELAGALGLLLPSLLRWAPSLTPLAASGLTTIMALAAALHIYRGEVGLVFVPTLLGVLTALVAWGRFRKAPIAPR